MLSQRRRFIAIAAGGVAQTHLALRAAGAAEFEYKYHHDQPLNSPMHVRVVQLWNEVAQATNGRLVVRVFPNSALGSDAAVITQIRAGAVQFASLAPLAATGVIPAIGILGIGFAFKSQAAVLAGIDGGFGDGLRREIEVKGFRVIAKPTFEGGMKQMTTSVRPIAGPADLVGLKMRVVPSRVNVDLFRTLGANPTPVDFSQSYMAMQTHLVDGTETSLATLESARIFEVQHYLSMTNHTWGGEFMVANPGAWGALPGDVQQIVERLASKYVAVQRRDIEIQGKTLLDKLARQGMVVNAADSDAFRARLGPYYARWKAEFSSTLWTLLEDYSGGKLG